MLAEHLIWKGNVLLCEPRTDYDLAWDSLAHEFAQRVSSDFDLSLSE